MVGIRQGSIVEVSTDDHGIGRLLHVGFDYGSLIGSIAVGMDKAGGDLFYSLGGVLRVAAGEVFVNFFFVIPQTIGFQMNGVYPDGVSFHVDIRVDTSGRIAGTERDRSFVDKWIA